MSRRPRDKLPKMLDPNCKLCGHTRRVEESPSLGPWRQFTAQREQRAGAVRTITNTEIPLSAATYSLTETGFYRWCHRTGATSFPKAREERKRASPADSIDGNSIRHDTLGSNPKMKRGTWRATTNKMLTCPTLSGQNRAPPDRRLPAGLSKLGCTQRVWRKSF